jgi:type I restriction enzyme, S subunit
MTSSRKQRLGWASATLPVLVGTDGLIGDGDWVESRDQDPNGTVRLTQLADVGDGYFRDRSERFLRPDQAERLGCTFLKAGDVMVARMPDPLGRACLYPGGPQPAVTVVDVCIIRPGATGVSTRWLMQFINAPQFRFAVAGEQRGSTRKRISKKSLCELELPLPPSGEQTRIADEVDSYLTRLDDAVASLERVQAKLKAYRASVLKAAVQGRLVPTEAALARVEKRAYEPAEVLLARILNERRRRWEEAELFRLKAVGKTPMDDKWRAKYQEPVAPDTSTLPELPEGWCWVTVDQLAGHDDNTLCDGPFGSNLKTEHYTDHGPRVVRLQNIGDGVFNDEEAHISDSHFAQLRKHEVLPGDLLVASLGAELPRACLVPDWLGPAIVKADCLRFAVNPQLAEAEYVLHALNSPPTRRRTEKLVHGVGRPRVGLSLFRTTAVPLPPRAEQARITALVEQLVSTSAVIQRSAAVDSRRCARLRQSVLKWAFEGKLVDQDPNDEPAETLLARIRAERLAVGPNKKAPRRHARGAA